MFKKTSKNLSAKYHQENKERLQKKKSAKMVVKDIKIYQKMKTNSWLSIEKNITK